MTVTHGELDGLLWRDSHELRHETSVESEGALVPDHLLEAVEAVAVQKLADVRAWNNGNVNAVLTPRKKQGLGKSKCNSKCPFLLIFLKLGLIRMKV